MADIMVVTGGSRGIGAATARLGAEQGYDVCINYLANKAAANRVADDVKAAGRRAVAVQGDMADEADIGRLFETCERELGRPVALVNNAGITGPAGRVDDTAADAIRHVIDLNVMGMILCAREAVKRMSTRHGGSGGAIVNLSSAAATLGAPGEYVGYAASKGATDSFTVGLGKELAGEGIRVNAVAPGLIETDIHAAGRVERIAPTVPIGRGGSAEEVARAILFLLSDEAAYITGTILRVAGGR